MRLVDWLLKLYPRTFRARFRAELIDFIEADRVRARGLGLPRRGLFWLSTWSDLALGALRLRLRDDIPGPRVARYARAGGLARLLLGDVSLGLRSLVATPMVSSVIVLTLCLGIGMSAAIFSVVQSVLLEPLPYQAPDRLALIKARWVTDGVEDANHSGMDFERLREATTTFEDIAAVRNIRQNLTGLEVPRQVEVGWASSNLFELLGVAPLLGPGFTADAPPGTLVLSHHLWLDAFGGAQDVVGTVVRLDDYPYTVAGVLPRGFSLALPRFPARVDLWKVPDDWWQNGDVWSGDNIDLALFDLVGRTKKAAPSRQHRGR